MASLVRRAPVLTNNPDTPAPPLRCPSCDQPLRYLRTILNGLQPVERWDEFNCPGCGPFEYRHRTRRLRHTVR
jgi:hypothetical protein